VGAAVTVGVIRGAFEGADEFVPTTLFIATWKSVGYFDRNTDQVCIVSKF